MRHGTRGLSRSLMGARLFSNANTGLLSESMGGVRWRSTLTLGDKQEQLGSAGAGGNDLVIKMCLVTGVLSLSRLKKMMVLPGNGTALGHGRHIRQT